MFRLETSGSAKRQIKEIQPGTTGYKAAGLTQVGRGDAPVIGLSQPGGQIMITTVLRAPLGFIDLATDLNSRGTRYNIKHKS